MKSGFFDNTEVVSEDFARLVSGIVTSGVLDDDVNTLKITAGGGMKVSAAPGYCWIEGHFGKAEAAETLTIDTASGSVGRIDRIVARCDYESHKVYLTAIKGEEGAEPTPPPIVRDGTFYDLGLATVSVPAGTIEITDSLITDTRADNAVCGGCLMRTGVVLDLEGKADKSALAEANARIDKNAEDIAAQAARTVIRKSFAGGSAENRADNCSVNVPAELDGLCVLRLKADIVANTHTVDPVYGEELRKDYVSTCSCTITLIGIGDNVTVPVVITDGNSHHLNGSINAIVNNQSLTIKAKYSCSGYVTADKTTVTVSDIIGAFMT